MNFQRVAYLDNLWNGEMTGLEVGGKEILLVNLNDRVYAYADECPHQKSRLSEGDLTGNALRCARHHWEFDASTGCGINPQSACLRRFPVFVQGREILVDLDAPATFVTAEETGND